MRVLWFFPFLKNQKLPNSNSIWNARTSLNEFIRTPKCLVGKQNNYDLPFFFFTIELAGVSLLWEEVLLEETKNSF